MKASLERLEVYPVTLERQVLFAQNAQATTFLGDMLVIIDGVPLHLKVAGAPDSFQLLAAEAAVLSSAAREAIERDVLPRVVERYPSALRRAEEMEAWLRQLRGIHAIHHDAES